MNESALKENKGKKSFQKSFLMLDLYRRPFQFQLPPGNSLHYRTYIGSVFSLFNIILILSYASYKMQDLIKIENYLITNSFKENYYSWDQAFTRSDGFHVAAGIIDISIDPSESLVEDPEIGHLKFYIKSWDTDVGKLEFTELSTRYC